MADMTQMEATKVGFLKALVEEYGYAAVVDQLRKLADQDRIREGKVAGWPAANNEEEFYETARELGRCAVELDAIEKAHQ